jgi:hypothetical protein
VRPAVEVEILPCIYLVPADEHDKIVSEYGDSPDMTRAGDPFTLAVIEKGWVVGLTPFDWNDNDLEGDW